MIRLIVMALAFASYYVYVQFPNSFTDKVGTICENVSNAAEERGIKIHFHEIKCLQERRVENKKNHP